MKKLFSLKFWMLGVGILFFIISNQVVYAVFSGSVSTNPSTIDLVGMKRTFKVTENKDISFKSVGDSQTQTWKLYNTYERAQLHYPDEVDQGETLETIKENYTVYFAGDSPKNRLTDSQAYLDVKIEPNRDSQERKHEFGYKEESDIKVTFTKLKEFPDSWKGHDIMIRTKFYGYDFTGRLFTKFVYVKVNNAIPDRQGEYSIVQPLYYSDVNGHMTTVQPGILWLHVHNLENYKENLNWKQKIENTAFKSAGLNTTNLLANIIDEQEDWVKVKIDIPKNTKAPTRKTVINFMINGYGDFNGYIQPNNNIHEFIKPLCIESDFTSSVNRNADTIRKDDLTISLNRQQKQILHLYSGNSVENSYFTATQLDHNKYTVKVIDKNNNQVATDLHASLVNVDGGSAIEFTRDNSTSNKAYELQIYDKSDTDNLVFFRPVKTNNHATYEVIQPMYYSINNNKLTSVLPMKLNVQIFDANSINEDDLKQVIIKSGFTLMNPVQHNSIENSNSWNIKITERDADSCLVNIYYKGNTIDASWGSDLLPYSENYRPFYLSTDWNPFTGNLISSTSSIYTRRSDLLMKPVTIDSNNNVTAIPNGHLTDLKNLNVAIDDACNFTVGKNERGFTIKQNIDYKGKDAVFSITSDEGVVFARKVTSVQINRSNLSTLCFDEITKLQSSNQKSIIEDLNQRIKISGAVDLTSNQVNYWRKVWHQGICGWYWCYEPVKDSVEGVNNFVVRIDQLVNDNYNQYPTGLLLIQYYYSNRWSNNNNASAEYSPDGKYLIMHFKDSVKNEFTLSCN